MPTDPELKISLSQWNEKLDAIKELRAEIQQLKQEKHADPDDTMAQLRATVRAALPVVQYAVGEMDPATVRRWPWQKLTQFSNLLKTTFPEDQALVEMADSFLVFARECEETENFRAKRHNAARKIVGMHQAGDEPDDQQ